MSKSKQNESSHEGQRHAAELRDSPAHVAEMNSQVRMAETQPVQQRSVYAHHNGQNDHGVAIFGHDQIAELAHQLWVARGCPEGSPEVDWFQAAKELRSAAATGR